MKEKIYQALKQEYAHLGLGEGILMAQADSLATMGLVTDENLGAVVKAQKSMLEGLQKANDKRVADALAKAREDSTKVTDGMAKQIADLESKYKAEHEKAQAQNDKQSGLPDWYLNDVAKRRAEQESLTASIQELLNNNKRLQEGFDALQKDNSEMKAAKARQERTAFIDSKAKELKIPEWRISEGFAISPEMDESQITSFLSNVATNINTNMLPSNKGMFPMTGEKASKEEIAELAKKMVH